MTKKEVREILERVMTWPEERQEDAARVLSEMEEYDASDYRLTDEQAEEVRRPARSRTVRAMKIMRLVSRGAALTAHQFDRLAADADHHRCARPG
jgi:hypothetical protein